MLAFLSPGGPRSAGRIMHRGGSDATANQFAVLSVNADEQGGEQGGEGWLPASSLGAKKSGKKGQGQGGQFSGSSVRGVSPPRGEVSFACQSLIRRTAVCIRRVPRSRWKPQLLGPTPSHRARAGRGLLGRLPVMGEREALMVAEAEAEAGGASCSRGRAACGGPSCGSTWR